MIAKRGLTALRVIGALILLVAVVSYFISFQPYGLWEHFGPAF